MAKDSHLLSAFDPPSQQDWINEIDKKSPVSEKLIGQYDELQVPSVLMEAPEKSYDIPPRRAESWFITQRATEDNLENLKSLQEGVNQLIVEGVELQSLDGVEWPFIRMQWKGYDLPEIQSLVEGKGWRKEELSGAISQDPLGRAIAKGDWMNGRIKEIDAFKMHAEQVRGWSSSLSSVVVDGKLAHECGADASTELAFALSMANEYLGLGARVEFNLGLGVDYFLDIAKVRAARLLIPQVLEEYRQESMFLTAECGYYRQTTFGANNNLLRLTSGAMAGILGGADAIHIVNLEENESNRHLSRSMHHLLKEESFLDKVRDPAKGSYLIERLTNLIVGTAWKKLQEIESNGGFIRAMEAGVLQQWIAQDANVRAVRLNEKEIKVIGVNHFPDGTIQPQDYVERRVEFPGLTPIRLEKRWKGGEDA